MRKFNIQRSKRNDLFLWSALLFCNTGLLLHCHSAKAKSFGVHGHTFEIIEPDLLKQIGHKLKVLEENGTLAEHKNKLLQQAKKSISHPKPVLGISKATED